MNSVSASRPFFSGVSSPRPHSQRADFQARFGHGAATAAPYTMPSAVADTVEIRFSGAKKAGFSGFKNETERREWLARVFGVSSARLAEPDIDERLEHAIHRAYMNANSRVMGFEQDAKSIDNMSWRELAIRLGLNPEKETEASVKVKLATALTNLRGEATADIKKAATEGSFDTLLAMGGPEGVEKMVSALTSDALLEACARVLGESDVQWWWDDLYTTPWEEIAEKLGLEAAETSEDAVFEELNARTVAKMREILPLTDDRDRAIFDDYIAGLFG